MSSRKKRKGKGRRSRPGQPRRPVGLVGVAPPLRGSVDAVVTVQAVTGRLERCLRALKRELPKDSTIMVADAVADPQATEPHAEIATAARAANVRVDRSGHGQWDSRNRAAAHGYAPLILFIDGDSVISKGSWPALVSVMEREEVGIAGGLVLWDEGEAPPGIPAPSIKAGGFAFGVKLLPYARFASWQPDNPKVFARDDLQAVSVTFMVTRRLLYRSLSGFAANAFANRPLADVEYCLRARAQGVVVAFEPAASSLAGAEPLASSMRELQEGGIVLGHQAGHLTVYDEWAVL